MEPTDHELSAFLRRVARYVAAGQVFVTDYARTRAWDDLQWDEWDIREQARTLSPGDFERCELSEVVPGEVIWVFTPPFWNGGYLWIRLSERKQLIIISFHQG